jgi:FkbM family methyltransferase
LGDEIQELFSTGVAEFEIDEFGLCKVLNIDFGSVRSKDLFGLDEIIIFSWYSKNKGRYNKVLDLGANIGVHSLMMKRAGFQVTAYEPDPLHAALFIKMMNLNELKEIDFRQCAVGDVEGHLEFTRVLGNTTGSHLSGAKKDPYGQLETIEVKVDSFRKILTEGFDFVKMDVEGYEAKIIESLNQNDLKNTDIMMEIGSVTNAEAIFDKLGSIGVSAFSQKKNWREVTHVSELPSSYKEGSVFLSATKKMVWD